MPISLSVAPLPPTQPNHAHFGTDVKSAEIQGVRRRPTGSRFERAPLRRNELGSNGSVCTGSWYQRRAGHRTALLERTVYSDEGQVVTDSFMDYALPHAGHVPAFDVASSRCRRRPTRSVSSVAARRACAGGKPKVMRGAQPTNPRIRWRRAKPVLRPGGCARQSLRGADRESRRCRCCGPRPCRRSERP
jgi:hypothetical protein